MDMEKNQPMRWLTSDTVPCRERCGLLGEVG